MKNRTKQRRHRSLCRRLAQRLLAFAAAGTGDLDERLRALPLPTFAAAAQCLYALGWVTPKD